MTFVSSLKGSLLVSAMLLMAATTWAQAESESRILAGITQYRDGFNDVLAKGKLEQWLENWADDAVRIMPNDRQRGKSEIRAAYEGLLRFYSEMRLIESARRVEGGEGIWEGRFEGLHIRSGKRIAMPVTIRLRFGPAGKIHRMEAEFDVDLLVEQLRAQTA